MVHRRSGTRVRLRRPGGEPRDPGPERRRPGPGLRGTQTMNEFTTPPGATHPHLPQSRYVLPSFVERTNYGIKESNPYNKLFEERIIFLGAPIDDVVANDVIAQLILSLIHISEPTRRTPISYAVFCL